MAFLAAAGLLLAASEAAADPECLGAKTDAVEKAEVVLLPPTSGDMCLVDASQCSPSPPVPVPEVVVPPSARPILAPLPVTAAFAGCGVRIPWDVFGADRAGVTREILRPPR